MLSITNLKAGYNGKTVVDMPHLSLQQGHHCLITGKSGSGKTTLLYALAGLLPPISGIIILADMDITKLNKTRLDALRGRHIGIIYQTLHMVAALSVLQNLLLVQYAAGLKQEPNKATGLLS